MLRKPAGYVYSENERNKLAELCWFSEEVHRHDGVSVEEMIVRCYDYRADMGNDKDWVVDCANRKADFVRRRDLRVLVSLYILSGISVEPVDRDFDRYERELEPG